MIPNYLFIRTPITVVRILLAIVWWLWNPIVYIPRFPSFEIPVFEKKRRHNKRIYLSPAVGIIVFPHGKKEKMVLKEFVVINNSFPSAINAGRITKESTKTTFLENLFEKFNGLENASCGAFTLLDRWNGCVVRFE